MQLTGYNLTVIAVFTGATAIGIWLVMRKTDWPLLDRFLAALAVPGMLLLACICARSVLSAPFFGWNGARLAPTFALVNGYRLYYPEGVGPVLNTIYGPVTALLYLPATLAVSATGAVLMASVISSMLVFAPVVWLMTRTQRGVGLAALLCFGLLAMLSYPVKYAAFCVHADAPALGLAGLACAAIYLRKNADERKLLWLSAALAVLSVWAKQTMLLMPVALAVCVLWLFGAASFKRYVMAVSSAAAVAMLVFALLFGWEPLFFNLVTVPSRHPWQGDRIPCLLQAVQELSVASAFPLAMMVLGFFVRRRLGTSMGRWPVFALVGAVNIPPALLNLVKAGGDLNVLNLTIYFWLLAAILLLVETAEVEDNKLAMGSKTALAVLSAGLLVIVPARLERLPKIWRALDQNQQEVACRMISKNPGQVYFPNNPLAHLMAEGKLYHLSYGLIDRELGGFAVREEHFRAHLPGKMQAVVFGSLCAPADQATQEIVMKHLPHYVCHGRNQWGLTLYVRPDDISESKQKTPGL